MAAAYAPSRSEARAWSAKLREVRTRPWEGPIGRKRRIQTYVGVVEERIIRRAVEAVMVDQPSQIAHPGRGELVKRGWRGGEELEA